MSALVTLGRFGLFLARCLRAAARHPIPVERSIEEAYRVGVRSLPILLVISFFVGTNLALQGYEAFRPIGGQELLGMFVALAGVRELAPIMVAAMVAAKAGTEMASHIAVMRSKEQIDALEVMAIDPLWYLVTPRFIPPPDLTSPVVQAKPDGHFSYYIGYGGAIMPPYGEALSVVDRWDIVNYLRTLAKKG